MTRDYVLPALLLATVAFILTIVYTNIQTGLVLAFGLVLGVFIGIQFVVKYRNRFEDIIKGSVMH